MLQAAVKVDPNSAEAHNFLGSALSSTGRTQEAMEQFRIALSLRPDYPNARFNLGNALVKSGKLEEAIGEYKKILETNPDDELTKERLNAILNDRKVR